MPHKTHKQPLIDVGDEDFNRVMAGLEEAGTIVSGTAAADSYQLHQVRVPETVDVKAIRAKTGLSQVAFARRYGFSVGAVRDWEQRRKPPEKANRLLLTIIERRPEVIDDLLTAAPEEYRPKRNDRVALHSWELSDEDIRALEVSEAPPESAQFNHEVEEG